VVSLGAPGLWAALAPKALPDFAGWQKVSTVQVSPASLPPRESALVTEFGVASIERATYQHEDRKLTVEAMLFRDASGAFGAYTFLAPGNFHPFEVRQPHAAGLVGDNHIIFYRGPWLVRTDFQVVDIMSAPEIRELAGDLPEAAGVQNLLPTLPLYLPKPNYIDNSLRYAEGPTAIAAAESWLPSSAIGFDQGAEVVSASYDVASPPAQMLVISYPTPQIAAERLRSFAALAKGHTTAALLTRQSGPLLVLMHGANGPEAHRLLASVNYHADITWNEPTPVGIEGLPRLILAIFALVGILIALALGVGLATGWFRVALTRLFPQKFGRPHAADEIIRLGLS
jgi:hypothetical protein